MNADRYRHEKEMLSDEYFEMKSFTQEEYKKNSKHTHFKTRTEMIEAMCRDSNPYNTFSFGEDV